MTSPVKQRLRENIIRFISGLPVPESTADEAPERRTDGVLEFGKHWCVRGDQQQGVFASFSDRDDVIEFGLLERTGDVAVNLLHVTVVLDDETSEVNCISESNADFNFDVHVTPEKQERLNDALRFFAEGLQGAGA